MNRFIALTALLFLAACDSESEPTSRFTATVTGAVELEVEGTATFGPEGTSGSTGFRLDLDADDRTFLLFVYRERGGVPEPGTYALRTTLDPSDDFGVLMYINSPDFPNFVGADAGTLTVSSSSAGEMQGTVELEASNGEADPVTVQVEFAAVRR